MEQKNPTSTAASSSGKSANSVVKKLDEIVKMKKGRLEMANDVVFAAMLVFATSVDELEQNEVKAFFEIASDQYMPIKRVETVLNMLSKSKSVRHRNLLLDLLSKKMFEDKWRQVSFASKLSLCTSWIETKVNEARQKLQGSRTVTVCQAINDLMSCSLNVFNKGLVEQLWKRVSKMFFRNDEFLKVFKNVENLLPTVEEGYKNEVKAILNQDPCLLRKPPEALKQWSQSR